MARCALALFKLGYSGRVASLAIRGRLACRYRPGPRLVRLNIGLEEPRRPIADLAQAFERAR